MFRALYRRLKDRFNTWRFKRLVRREINHPDGNLLRFIREELYPSTAPSLRPEWEPHNVVRGSQDGGCIATGNEGFQSHRKEKSLQNSSCSLDRISINDKDIEAETFLVESDECDKEIL